MNFLISKTTKIKLKIGKHIWQVISLILSLILFLVFFVGGRLWFFVDLPLPILIFSDTVTYYLPISLIYSGQLPDFSIRPPAYPLFLELIFQTTQSLLGVIIFQVVISCIALMCLICCVLMLVGKNKILGIFVALGIGLWSAKSGGSVFYDFSILSDSLYTSFCVLGFAFWILSMHTKNFKALTLSSFTMGLAFLVRPSGIFFSYVLIGTFLFSVRNNTFGKYLYICVSPLFICIFLMCSYNYYLHSYFAPSLWTDSNLSGVTSFLWKESPSPRYPEKINQVLIDVKRDKEKYLTQYAVSHLMNSSDDEFYKLVDMTFVSMHASVIAAFAKSESINLSEKINSDEFFKRNLEIYLRNRHIIARLNRDAIADNSLFYLRWISTMFKTYFKNFNLHGDVILAFIQSSVLTDYYSFPSSSESIWSYSPVLKHIKHEYINPPALPALTNNVDERLIYDTQNAGRLFGFGWSPTPNSVSLWIKPTIRIQFFLYLQKIIQMVFQSRLWLLGFFAVLVLAMIRLIQSNARDLNSFIIFILGSSVILHACMISMLEVTVPRYSYPLEWIYPTVIFISPLMLFNILGGNRKISK